MINEWLQVLSDIIEADVQTAVHHSPAIGLMCDESTDISVTSCTLTFCVAMRKRLTY